MRDPRNWLAPLGPLAPDLAGIAVPVLDEARARIGVEPLEQLFLADVDLLLFERGRDGDHDRELLQVPLEVVRHRHHGAIAVVHDRDL